MMVRNAPVLSTTFIGRESELKSLMGLLSDPSCRLLTLTGLGGMGKTRLALKLAEQAQEEFSDGACFVPLQPLESSDQIVHTLMTALDIRTDQKPHDELLAWLRNKNMLLVLDSFEHLMDGVDILVELLASAPKLKLLVTSRDALRLQDEWLYQLLGLDFPSGNPVLQDGNHGAIQLFTERARQQGNQLNIATRYADIARICQLVEGMPLALELAAGWVKFLSLREIIGELERSITLLKSRTRDIPDRHSSIEAVFDYSWQLLTEQERVVMQGCSVFRGGCTRDAAEKITGATQSVLTSLVEKSWLRHDPENERFDLHELMRLYLWEKLALTPDVRESVLDRHCEYYADLLHRQGMTVFTNEWAKILPEMDNLRTAWKRAVQRQNLVAIERASPSLNWLYHLQAWFEEGSTMFYMAEQALREMPLSGDVRFLLGSLQLYRGYCNVRQGMQSTLSSSEVESALALWEGLEERPDMGAPLSRAAFLLFYDGEIGPLLATARKSLAFHQRHNDLHGQAIALTTLAAINCNVGNFAEAQQLLDEALTIDHQIGFTMNAGWAESVVSRIMHLQGRYREAKAHAEARLAHRQSAGIRSALEDALHSLGFAELETGDDASARSHFEESITVAFDLRQQGAIAQGRAALGILAAFQNDLNTAATCYTESLTALQASALHSFSYDNGPENLGFLALLLGHYDHALAYYEAEISRFVRRGYRIPMMWLQSRLGQVLIAQGNEPEAMSQLFDAFREAAAMGAFQFMLEALLGIAQLSLVPPSLAAELLNLIREHSASNRYSRIRAQHLLSAMELPITRDAQRVTLERRKALTLEASVKLVEHLYSRAKSPQQQGNQQLTDPLSEREIEILTLMADGYSNREIAFRLFVGVSTVKKHINHIYSKLAVTHRAQAVAVARSRNILP